MIKSKKLDWLKLIKSSSSNNAVIYFPYAGGNSYDFEALIKYIDLPINFLSIQLPGRGSRMHEPPIDDIRLIIENISNAISHLPYDKIILLGYSFGAILVYEVACIIKNKSIKLIVSAMDAPHKLKFTKEELTFHLPDEMLINKLNKMNLYSNEILNNKDLWDMALPYIRADIKMCELYSKKKFNKLDIPITVQFGSEDDIISIENILLWKELTFSTFQIKMIHGGHFFIKTNPRSYANHLIMEFQKTFS